jgi:Tol biopolymer transport system component
MHLGCLRIHIILWSAMLVALSTPPLWAYEVAPGVTIRQLTKDGGSRAERGLGWSPTGSLLAYDRTDSSGKWQLVVRTADGGSEWTVKGLGGPCRAAWSPDGKRIAYLFSETRDEQSEGRLYVWSRESGAVEVARGFKHHQFIAGGGFGIIWAPNSRHFAIMIRRSSQAGMAAWVFDAEGGPGVQLVPNHHATGDWYPAAWSPDSQWVVFWSQTSADARGGVWTCRRDGSEARELVPVSSQNWVRDPLWSPDGKWIAYGSNADRLQDEIWMHDLWLVRPDGSDNHPITHGSRAGTEGRMRFDFYRWSPDSRKLCALGARLDAKGIEHLGLYVIDIEAKNVTPIISGSRESSVVYDWMSYTTAWDHSGRRLAFTARQWERHGEPGPTQQLTDRREFLAVFDTGETTLTKLVEARVQDDARMLALYYLGMPSWSPDDANILFSMGKVTSLTDGKYEPDLYMAELPRPAEAVVVAPQPTTALATPAANGLTSLVIPQQRRATEVAEALPDEYDSMYQVDPGLNALVVSAPDEATLEAFRRDVALLDQPVAQIMVDVLVTELSHDGGRQLGLDWEYARGHFGATLPTVFGDAGQVIYQGVGTLDKAFFGTLSALAEKGEANVRSNPRVLARCGSPSTINIRRTDNFLFESGMDSLGRPVRSRSDISADIILKITPQCLGGERIALAVDATVDSFIFGAANDLPDTTRRQAVTDVVCGDGETIIIGGLTQTEETSKVSKTPLLGDLPIIGSLFRHTTRSQRDTTLVIFITPRQVATKS